MTDILIYKGAVYNNVHYFTLQISS